MPFSDSMEKATLDWVTGAAAATRPSARWISFATASPDINNAFDGPFSPRNTATFAAANSPQGSVTNLNSMTLVTATASGTAVGWNLWDASVGGNRIVFGTLSAVIGCKSADNITIAPGALKIVLS